MPEKNVKVEVSIELTEEQTSKIADAMGLKLSRLLIRRPNGSARSLELHFEEDGGFEGGGGSSGGGGAGGKW